MYFGKDLFTLLKLFFRWLFYVKDRNAMVNIFEYKDHRQYLKDAYKHKKTKQKNFSHRYITQQMGLKSPSAFNKILRGRTKISEKSIEKLSQIFKLNKRETKYFELLVKFNQASAPNERRERLMELTTFIRANMKLVKPQQYELYDKWYYNTIRTILSYYQCYGDTKELGKLLDPPISSAEAAQSLKVLERLDLIKKNDEGYYKPTDQIITTGDKASSTAINTFQLETLKLAQRAMDRIPKEKREFSTLTINLTEETFQTVKEELQRCRRRILEAIRNQTTADRVYQANFQLFPLSKVE